MGCQLWAKENRDEIGPLWRRRLHGSLFFSWHFPVSNNKLRLLVSKDSANGLGGLGELFTDEGSSEWSPRLPQLKRRFMEQLKAWHGGLDKETTFHDLKSNSVPQRHVFKSVTFGHRVPNAPPTFQVRPHVSFSTHFLR